MTVIQASYGIKCGEYFARPNRETVIEITERRGSDVWGYVDNTNDAVSKYLPLGRIKVCTINNAIVER